MPGQAKLAPAALDRGNDMTLWFHPFSDPRTDGDPASRQSYGAMFEAWNYRQSVHARGPTERSHPAKRQSALFRHPCLECEWDGLDSRFAPARLDRHAADFLRRIGPLDQNVAKNQHHEPAV
jgi:hypothetical protein